MDQVPNLPKTVQRKKSKTTGLINPQKVRIVSFSMIVMCILISVVSCIMAIWDFTNQDSLWRTVATCVVVAGGMMGFSMVNAAYGKDVE